MPGGPIEQIIAELDERGLGDSTASPAAAPRPARAAARASTAARRACRPSSSPTSSASSASTSRRWQRFLLMLGNYLTFDFGESYFRSISVVDLVLEKMPVSITLGLWSTLLAYLISIPLGIRKAIRDGIALRHRTSGAIIVAYAIPSFLFAIMLLVLFAGGSYWQIFPLRGLTSDNWDDLSLIGKVARLPLAHRAAGDRLDHRRLRHDDAADQELLPRRDQEAVRDDRPRQGPDRAAGCSTATSSATPC